MVYQCPRGHQSTDPDYCSECGAKIGQSGLPNQGQVPAPSKQENASTPDEICPDCGSIRVGDARFCEVCRHDFLENKTGVAEVIVASQKTKPENDAVKHDIPQDKTPLQNIPVTIPENNAVPQRLNIVISVDGSRALAWDVESPVKPDSKERVFPLDLDENLVGRRSNAKGIYPEIDINDPGVSHRHMKFIKQPDGSFCVLELGSSNGTELNGAVLEPGVNTPVKAGDELDIGIWTHIKIVSR